MPSFRYVAAIFAVMGLVPGAGAAERSLNDLSGPWQLFVDDYPISSKTNLARTYHPFQKYAGNPVLVGDRPWEYGDRLPGQGIVYLYGSVLPNESGPGYRMWYACLPWFNSIEYTGSNTLYATSTDGVTWSKPNMGVRSWNGSTNNNMFYDNRTSGSGITSVMHTPWDTDPQRKYRFMNYEGGFWGAYSADGTHTVDVPGNPVFTGGSDVGQFMWDPHTQRYRGYVKNGWLDSNGLQRRAVALTETTNIESWPTEQLILTPDAYDDRWSGNPILRTHFYGFSAFAYESMYIGFLWIFRADSDPEGYFKGPVFAEIVTSHDGVNWEREQGTRPAMLPLGASGTWDDGQLYTATQPLVEGGVMKLYYGACDQPHGTGLRITTCAIGLSTLRKDGFASLDAGSTEGSVTTHTLSGAGGTLLVNCTAAGGSVRVEVLDPYEHLVPGYSAADCVPLQSDAVDQPVTWVAHSQLPDLPSGLRLRFILQNASLYSFRTDDPVQVLPGPKFTLHPQGVSACPGDAISFSTAASGAGVLTYEWQRDGVTLASSSRISGVDSPALTIDPAYESDAAVYRCVVRDSVGSATSNEAACSFSLLHFADMGAFEADRPIGMSADGSVVCGRSNGAPVIWTRDGGLVSLGLPPGASAAGAVGVGHGPGGLVVAVESNAASLRAKRWDGTAAGIGAWSSLPRLDGVLEWQPLALGTNGVSDVWIAGSAYSGGDGGGRAAALNSQAAGTAISPPMPPSGHDHSDFHAVSDNGVCAGQYQYKGTAPGGGARNAIKYAGVSSALNTLIGVPSTSVEAVAKALSRDGAVAGGWSYYTGGGSKGKPVIWNGSTPTAVPFLSGGDADNHGEVLALSGDGSLAGGYTAYRGSPQDGPKEAFIWTATAGTRRLRDVLTSEYGLPLEGWSLQAVRAISNDGKVLAGHGFKDGVSSGWMVRLGGIPQPPDITAAPQAQFAHVGGTAHFNVEAAGAGALTFRWQKDDADLSDDGHYAGVQTDRLSVRGVDPSVAGAYRCVVSVHCGVTASASAALTLVPPADLDRDGDVDIADVEAWQACALGSNVPVPAECANSDLDGDGDVDPDDFGALQRCYRGPAVLPELTCTALP